MRADKNKSTGKPHIPKYVRRMEMIIHDRAGNRTQVKHR